MSRRNRPSSSSRRSLFGRLCSCCTRGEESERAGGRPDEKPGGRDRGRGDAEKERDDGNSGRGGVADDNKPEPNQPKPDSAESEGNNNANGDTIVPGSPPTPPIDRPSTPSQPVEKPLVPITIRPVMMEESQKFKDIKEDCLRTGKLYEDPDFPATRSMLFQNSGYLSRVEWKRPKEISDKPFFGKGGQDYFDMNQGSLGNCWFVSSVVCLAASPHKNLLNRVVPTGQDFGSDYCGAFRFYFWQYGKWVEVIVDDRLPTLWDQLLYCSNEEHPNEYWCPLLEKAYAKLHGNYNNIDGGRIFESMVDLTSGIGEIIKLKGDITTKKLSKLLHSCFKMNSFIGGGIFLPQDRVITSREQRMANGLYQGHAYSVVDVKDLDSRIYGKVTLLHMRNPWGKGEWNGAWSDNSREYQSLPTEDRNATFRRRDDGEFWISVDDFRKNFDELELCHLTPDAFSGELAHDLDRNQWKVSEHFGSWIIGQSAGGPLTSFQSRDFYTNPQFELRLADAEESTSVVVSLLEVQEVTENDGKISIGFVILKYLRYGRPRRISLRNYQDFTYWGDSGLFWPYRERTKQFVIEPGEYIIVPCTFRKNQEANFFMRVFSEQSILSEPLSENEEEEKPEEVQPEEKPDEPKPPTTPTPTTPTPTTPTPTTPTPTTPTSDKDSAEQVAMEEFVKIAGTGGATDAEGLMYILKKALVKEDVTFGLTTCRLFALYAKNNQEPGMVNKEQFEKIWKDLGMWRKAFKSLDADNTGEMEADELNQLFRLLDFGEGASAVVDSIIAKYGGKSKSVSEEDFIQSFVQVLNLLSLYRAWQDKGKISMPSYEWLAAVLMT